MTTITQGDNATRTIRDLNDKYRQAWGVYPNGRVVMTHGIHALPDDVRSRVCEAVQKFNDFSRDNDPHGEHDFGAFKIEGLSERVFWKFDYYDATLRYLSEDPADPLKTVRVLTIMLASEY